MTRVESMSKRGIVVQRPAHSYDPIRLPRGTKVELQITVTEPTAMAGKYRAETVVLAEIWQPVPLLRLQTPEQWERSQLREFFRVPTAQRVRVRTLPATGDAGWFEAHTRDLSGGGCQLVVPQVLEEGQTIEIVLPLADEVFRLRGTVQRMQADATDGGSGGSAGIEFSDVTEKQRETIIRYAFERQIELRKKGMT